MPTSRKRKKKIKTVPNKKKVKPYQAVKQKLWMVDPPDLGDMSFEDRLAMFLEIAEQSTEQFGKNFDALLGYFREYDPLYLISLCAMFFVSKPEGVDEEAIEGKLDFPPFFLEIMQCVALFQERPVTFKPLNEQTGEVKDTITALNQNQKLRYYSLVKGVGSEEDMGAALLRMDMMLHTLAVRNWAHLDQMRKITVNLSALIREEFSRQVGFDPVTLFRILFSLDDLANERLNTHIAKLRKVLMAKKPEEAFKRAAEILPSMGEFSDAGKESLWEHSGKNIRNLTYMMSARFNMQIAEVYTFSEQDLLDISAGSGITIEEVSMMFSQISYGFGDLADAQRDHIFLDNPIHNKPFIKLEDGRFFSILPFLMPHLSLGLLENFVKGHKALKDYYHLKKGKYLEEEIERIFTAGFPSAKIFGGSMWSSGEDGKTYENDLLVVIDDFALVIEAKSGTVTSPARRGAPSRLFETLEELIVEPSQQAIRFQNYLKNKPQAHEFKTKRGVINSVDSSAIKYYVPISVTLSTLGSIGCNLKKLTRAKVIGQSMEELAPSLTITDLELIFDILGSEAEKIHYLSRRREFTAHAIFEGDEIDLLGFYLETGFNIGDEEYNEELYLGLTLKSKEVDPYFTAKERGVSVRKPALQMTKFWRDLLSHLKRHSKMWLKVSYILLNAPISDQRDFEKNFEKLKLMVTRGNLAKPVNWLSFRCGPERRQYTIVGYASRAMSREERNEILNQITEAELKNKNRGLIILGYNLDTRQYPFSFVAGTLDDDFFDVLN